MPSVLRVLIEAVVIGSIVVVVAYLVGWLLGTMHILKVDLPDECKDWNKLHIMEVTLFITGFLMHIFFEALGLNRWYVQNYTF